MNPTHPHAGHRGAPGRRPRRFARWLVTAGLSAIALLLIPALAATAGAAPSAAFVSEDNWAGYVTLNTATLYSDSVAFDVTISATKGEVPVNPFYFVAKAADGTSYNNPTYAGDNYLRSGDLPAGERVRGVVTLKVTGPKPTALIYEGVLGRQLAKWNLRWKTVAPKAKPKPPVFGSLS